MSYQHRASPTRSFRLLLIALLAILLSHGPIKANWGRSGNDKQQQKKWGTDDYKKYVHNLRAKDTCGTVFSSKIHGYDVKEYTITTKDNYMLTLHRLIHPQDIPTGGPATRAKKPYLLLHGLVGSSASYVRNVDPDYQAPLETIDINRNIDEVLWKKADDYEFTWKSTADSYAGNVQGGTMLTAQLNEIDFDADQIPFAKEFKQSYRKFNMPKESLDYVSNSLAFTMSNFGYDVWLINLRGNDYSKKYAGRYTSDSAEYWDFNIDTIIREDLLASINFVSKTTDWQKPMGFVSFSYTSAHVLGLLTAFPEYQDTLQPVVMIAPTLLTGTPDRSILNHVVKFTTDIFMSSNGPFPAIGRMREDKIEKLLCKLPLASKLCKLLETILYGRPKSLTRLVFNRDRQLKLVKHDTECGQTSKQVLYQLLENLHSARVHPKFTPFTSARLKVMSGKPVRRSVMLVHSQDDDVATNDDVSKIRESALRLLALSDYSIKRKDFGHSDFLFGEHNQLLVNAEIMRQIRLFDFMIMYSTPKLQAFGQNRYVKRRGAGSPQVAAAGRASAMAGPQTPPPRSAAISISSVSTKAN